MKNNINNTKHKVSCKSRLGQMEVFGLAVIVVLVSIGFFIFVSYKMNHKTDNPQAEFTNDKMANDFVLSIIDVTVSECPNYNIQDLIIDCAKNHQISCGGEDSCIAVNRTIYLLLNKTFIERNAKFRLYSEKLDYEGHELLNISNRNCTDGMSQGQRGLAIISLYPWPGNVNLNMNICT